MLAAVEAFAVEVIFKILFNTPFLGLMNFLLADCKDVLFCLPAYCFHSRIMAQILCPPQF